MAKTKAKEFGRKEPRGRKEARLVGKGIRAGIEKIRSGEIKTTTLKQAIRGGVFK